MRKAQDAFSRIELLAVIASVAIVACLALPALGNSRSRSQTAQCLNNLRLMGRATLVRVSYVQEQVPWRVLSSEGGTLPEPNGPEKPGVAWFEYLWLSNDLATPRLLTCPADTGVIQASSFDEYKSVGFRGSATSYLLNLHATSDMPDSMLFGDRNLKFDSYGAGSCVARVANLGSVSSQSSNYGWSNAVHGFNGNVALVDGSVAETGTPELRAILNKSDENGSGHLLKAR